MLSDSIFTQDSARAAYGWFFRDNDPNEAEPIDPPDNAGGGLGGDDHKHDYDDPPDSAGACDPPTNRGGGA